MNVIQGGIFLLLSFASCRSTNQQVKVESQEYINKKKVQVEKLNQLLKDESFALTIGSGHDPASFSEQGQTDSLFRSEHDSTLKKRVVEEKVAINLAGLYAVECGIGALMEISGHAPAILLQKIVDGSLDSGSMFLLQRFANATWKAGQPFRDLKRITRDNFIVADGLSREEVQKDYDQILAAATLLLDSLKATKGTSKEVQLGRLNQLLKDQDFAYKTASYIEAAYYKGIGEPAPLFLKPGDDTAVILKSSKEQRIAIRLAGFYALECGIGYLSSVQKKLPSDIIKSIVSDDIDQADKKILERFANATWKAGQPFRSLSRISRDIFMPFDLLPEDEIKKDWDQIKSAATLVEKVW